ncbi:MAG: hypothetical protein BWK80_25855 [Desulfobacteraceae bacterium IS3]|nr:MAG: hypothetical protein BWK80_25855 [Desulfobacteraceae bacterium IS3]
MTIPGNKLPGYSHMSISDKIRVQSVGWVEAQNPTMPDCYRGKLPDIVLSWESSLIIGILGHYHGKLPDIVLSWENSLITGVLGHYQGKLPDNQWLVPLHNSKEMQ